MNDTFSEKIFIDNNPYTIYMLSSRNTTLDGDVNDTKYFAKSFDDAYEFAINNTIEIWTDHMNSSTIIYSKNEVLKNGLVYTTPLKQITCDGCTYYDGSDPNYTCYSVDCYIVPTTCKNIYTCGHSLILSCAYNLTHNMTNLPPGYFKRCSEYILSNDIENNQKIENTFITKMLIMLYVNSNLCGSTVNDIIEFNGLHYERFSYEMNNTQLKLTSNQTFRSRKPFNIDVFNVVFPQITFTYNYIKHQKLELPHKVIESIRNKENIKIDNLKLLSSDQSHISYFGIIH